MIRKCLISICTLCCLWATVFVTPAYAIEPDLAPEAKSAVLMEATTGQVLYEKNSHTKLAPASVTKVMTMLMIMEALEQGKIRLHDLVQTSEHAASMGGTQIFLQPGEQMSVEDLLKGIAISSANDAAVAMAEKLAGSEANFVELMNQRARQLGCRDTHFVNSNGLPTPNHVTSAHDIAVISRELLKYPEILKFTSRYEDYLRKGSKKPFWLVNTNKLLKLYPSVDGLKTGFTGEAKYCLSATAKKGNLRMIAVVMGEPEIKTRNRDIINMFNHSFANYNYLQLYKKGEFIIRKKIKKASSKVLNLKAPHDIGLLYRKGQTPQRIERSVQWVKTEAPIRKGDLIGRLQIKQHGQVIQQVDLHSDVNIDQAGFWSSLKKSAQDLLQLDDEEG